MRSRFAVLLAIVAVCVTTAWASWTPEALVIGGSARHSLLGNGGNKLVFGPDGVGHLIWRGASGNWCNRYDPLSGWKPDVQISASTWSPAIALDDNGTTIHAVWQDTCVFYRRCDRTEQGEDVWSDVVRLGAGGGTLNASVACVPGDPNHVVACWDQSYSGRKGYEAIGFNECVGGVWGTPIRLDSAVINNFRRIPSIAVGPNGDVYIAYYNGARHVSVKTRHNGVWGTTVDVTSGLGTDQCSQPAIEVNPITGNPHVVFSWMRILQINKKLKDTLYAAYHTYRNSQGAWLPVPELISVVRNREKYGFPDHYPTMAFLDNGAAYAVWEESYPLTSRGVQYSCNSVESGTWTSPAWLNSDTTADYRSSWPHVAYCGVAQTVYAVWSRTYDDMLGVPTEIWWTSNYMGDGGGMGRPVALSQSRIELFPNPATAGRVTVQYALPHAGQAIVTLLDVSGRAVRTQEVAAGIRGTFAIDLRGLNAGVYVMKLDAGATSLTRKVVLTE